MSFSTDLLWNLCRKQKQNQCQTLKGWSNTIKVSIEVVGPATASSTITTILLLKPEWYLPPQKLLSQGFKSLIKACKPAWVIIILRSSCWDKEEREDCICPTAWDKKWSLRGQSPEKRFWPSSENLTYMNPACCAWNAVGDSKQHVVNWRGNHRTGWCCCCHCIQVASYGSWDWSLQLQ